MPVPASEKSKADHAHRAARDGDAQAAAPLDLLPQVDRDLPSREDRSSLPGVFPRTAISPSLMGMPSHPISHPPPPKWSSSQVPGAFVKESAFGPRS
jgi:hypothetical protein